MELLSKIKQRVKGYLPLPGKELGSEKGYNLWAEQYDAQPDNLMLALDEYMFSTMIDGLSLKNRIVADVGCGTGRHWRKIYDKGPSQLLGFDISEEMLKMLQKKYPYARTYHIKDDNLDALDDGVCDLIISTLTVGHIKNIGQALREWCRVLKDNGEIIITDYHPETLGRGGDRTFYRDGKLVAIKNYVHPIHKLNEIAQALNLKVERFQEKVIDESMKHYYTMHHAEHVFDRFNGVPIIYGLHLKRMA